MCLIQKPQDKLKFVRAYGNDADHTAAIASLPEALKNSIQNEQPWVQTLSSLGNDSAQ